MRLRALLPFVVAAAIVQGGFRVWIRPAREATLVAERKQVQQLEADLHQREESAAGGDQQVAEAVRFDLERTTGQIEALRQVLSAGPEAQEILDSLAGIAGEEGLRVRRFAPEPGDPEGTFVARSAAMEAEGQYFDYVRFFERVANLRRTVIIDDFELLAPTEPDRPLPARFVAVTVGHGADSADLAGSR